MKDYLIVGSGLAGISFAQTCLENGKSFDVMDNNSTTSTRVAGGMYNPVILKRYSEVWRAKEQMELALPMYDRISEQIHVAFNFKTPIYRKFASVEEQNNWFQAADKPAMAPFLSTQIINKTYAHIPSPFGYGEVLYSGYLNTKLLLDGYIAFLQEQGCFVAQTFDYNALQILENTVVYDGKTYQNVIFAEGYGLQYNPFFNHLPLDGTKGELMVVKIPNLDIDFIFKAGVFLIPLGGDMYKVGATYNWTDKTDVPTPEGRKELEDELKSLVNCPYEVLSHYAGVRPTVKDRRPLVGQHHQHQNLFVLNGLGTRGVMLGPYLAQALFNFIEVGQPLEAEINISRMYKKLGIRI